MTEMQRRIKANHDKRCENWEMWTTREADIFGKTAVCHWVGCRKCNVAILTQES